MRNSTSSGKVLGQSIIDKLTDIHTDYGRGDITSVFFDEPSGQGLVVAKLQYGWFIRTFTIDTEKMRLRYLGHVRKVTKEELP